MPDQENERCLPIGEQTGTIQQPPCPSTDRTVGIINNEGESSAGRIVRSLKNGCYQHMMFTGIAGFVICNHCDREILLVDPWPSFCSRWTDLIFRMDPRPLTAEQRDAKQRLGELASFLRNAVRVDQPEEERYTISGILVSHMHFDHAEDIIVLLELLAAEEVDPPFNEEDPEAEDPQGYTHVDIRNLGYRLEGPPIPVDRLPKICCDFDTMFYFLTYYFYVPYQDILSSARIDPDDFWYGNDTLQEALDERAVHHPIAYAHPGYNKWCEIRDRYSLVPGEEVVRNDNWLEIAVEPQEEGAPSGLQRLHYDDSYNVRIREADRCRAGVQCQTFFLDHFRITPYVWDHMNTGSNLLWFTRMQRARDEQTAGSLQRFSAWMVEHSGVTHAKRTFIVGSSGEMHRDWTRAFEEDLQIETDLLIQAITRPNPHWAVAFETQIDHYLKFLAGHINVLDAVVFVHFEEFVRRIAYPDEFVENRDAAVPYNLERLQDKIAEVREEGESASADSCERLLQQNRFYTFARRGTEFETEMPDHPIDLKNESTIYHETE